MRAWFARECTPLRKRFRHGLRPAGGTARAALVALALAGCGGGGGGPAGPVSGEPPLWTQGCGTPDPLFSPRFLGLGPNSLGIINSMAADSEVLFFATDKAVYRVPAAGGEPETLIPEAGAYSIGTIWRAGGRFLVSRLYAGEDLSVLELPRTGTDVSVAIDSIPFLPDEYRFGARKIFWIDEDHVYWQANRPFTRDGKELAAYPLHRMPWHGQGPVENLVELTANLSGAWKQGETLWILDYPGYYDSLERPRLLSLPAAGGAVSYHMNFERGEWLVSGDGNSLYFQLTFMNGAYHPGMGRLRSLQGAGVDYLFSGHLRGVWPESDRVVVADYGLIDANPAPTRQDLGVRLWTIPLAGGAPDPAGCLAGGTGYVGAIATSGKRVYMAFLAEDTKFSGIAKFTLP
jgi:hypothetical protein